MGVNNEAEAVKAFTKLTGKTVQETGIWLDLSGILGASPDGIVDDESVLEAKCPNTERNITIEEAVNPSPNFCLTKCEKWLIRFEARPHLLAPGAKRNIFYSKEFLLLRCLDK